MAAITIANPVLATVGITTAMRSVALSLAGRREAMMMMMKIATPVIMTAATALAMVGTIIVIANAVLRGVMMVDTE